MDLYIEIGLCLLLLVANFWPHYITVDKCADNYVNVPVLPNQHQNPQIMDDKFSSCLLCQNYQNRMVCEKKQLSNQYLYLLLFSKDHFLQNSTVPFLGPYSVLWTEQ